MIIRKLAYTSLALVIALSCGTATVHSASQLQARIGSGQTDVYKGMQRSIAPEAGASCARLPQERRVVCLALGFENTLPPEQRERIRYPFTASMR